MKVHIFGAISSQSCANFALQRVVEDKYDEEILSTIRHNFYVDDCLRSVPKEEGAIALLKGLRDACAEGGFRLTKWITNSQTVLASIPDEDKAKPMKERDLDCDKLSVERALGIRWNLETDTFTCQINVKNQPHTRRGLLSMVSSLYDPLGFLSPFVLKAKLILQELDRIKHGWDESIPEHLSNTWQKLVADLNQLSTF